MNETNERQNRLPSLWQLGDYVSVTFPRTGLLKKCKIIKIAFTEHSEPLYDVEVPYQYYEGIYDPESSDIPTTGSARIHGLKEWHLRVPDLSAGEPALPAKAPIQEGEYIAKHYAKKALVRLEEGSIELARQYLQEAVK